MAVFIATFSYDADAGRLAALRPARYAYFHDLTERGVLLASGQLTSGTLGDRMLVLRADDEAAARAVLADDPFAREGYVARLDLAGWNPTLGTWTQA